MVLDSVKTAWHRGIARDRRWFSVFRYAMSLGSSDLGINPFSADHEIGGENQGKGERRREGRAGVYPPCCCRE